MPRLDTRLSMLLSITALVVSDLIEEEESEATDEFGYVKGKRRADLIFSLQNLQDYQSLLTPPQSVIPSANQAAAKAMMFVSGINVPAFFECISTMDMPVDCCKYTHNPVPYESIWIDLDWKFVLANKCSAILNQKQMKT